MKNILCLLLGHEPRGPVKEVPVLYFCDRCKRLIRFDRERGWLYHE